MQTKGLTSKQKNIVTKTEIYVKKKLLGEGTGHDWWHIKRVQQQAIVIAKKERADLFVVRLGTLLHDIADWKFQKDKTTSQGVVITRNWLLDLGVNSKAVEKTCDIVENISFKGADIKNKLKTLEGKVVQDADRLDAIGAIGIGRTFAYGGFKNEEMYSPDIKVKMAGSSKEHQNTNQTTINHFYEKLLLLRDRMNTKTGRELAQKRHEFMKQFLQEFFDEWEGKK